MSAFVDALRINLRCPKCGALNRPGAYLIDLDLSTGTAVCQVCTAAWQEPLLQHVPERSPA